MAGFDNDVVYGNNADFSTAGAGGASAANGLQLDGQVWIGRTSVNVGGTHIDVGRITSIGGTVTVSNGAGTINLEVAGGGATVQTLSGDTGTAIPVANNIQIAGGPGITTSASGAVVTINSVVFTDTTAITLAVDNGYFATAAGTYPLPATAAQGEILIVVCDTAGAVVLDAPALNFIRIGSSITSSGGTATSNAIGDSLTLRYRLSTLTWEATSVIGTWTLA
ncbi:MAG: hypothetical protein WC089_03840 [Candidatus Paceibacterota bacterium]